MTNQSVLWRRVDQPGHESARVFFQDSRRHLIGTAVFAHQEQACRLDYRVICNSEWYTLSATVSGWVGSKFTTQLQINGAGLVTSYPNFWQVEGGNL